MAINEIHLSDIGTTLRLTVYEGSSALDISSATTKQFKFKKPDGTTTTVDASFTLDGSDGNLQYIVGSGFLDQAGTWQVQVYLVLPTCQGHSDRKLFEVYGNIS